MTSISVTLSRYKTRIARVVLTLFVLAWANLIFQAPAHAAMKMSHEMPCHCTHTLCDTVLTMQDQADDALSAALPMLPSAVAVFQLLPIMQLADLTGQPFRLADQVFLDISPHPLSRTGILRI